MEKPLSQGPVAKPGEGSIVFENPQVPATGKKISSAKARKEAAAAPSKDGLEPGDANETVTMKARKRTKTGCLTCRKRRIKCGEERPTCSNCVKSKRNCEGYIPRVIFKDPLGAYRPVAGNTQSSGAHFQSLSNQAEGNGSVLRAHSGISSQAALPPIAPRPSPPTPQIGTMQASPTVPQGSTAEQYSLFGYSFDGQTYGQAFSECEIPSSMPLDRQPQRNSFGSDLVSPKTESMSKSCFGSMPQPKLQHRTTGESDSGIDMTVTGYSSHSSTSSSGPPTVPLNLQIQDISPTSLDQQPRRSLDHPMEALFPHYVGQILPEQYSNPEQIYYPENQWPSHASNIDRQPFAPVDCHLPPDTLNTASYPEMTVPGQGYQGRKILLETVVESDNSPDLLSSGNQTLGPINNPAPIPQVPSTASTSGRYTQPVDIRNDHNIDDPDDDLWDVTSDEEMEAVNSQFSQTQPHDFGMMIAVSAKQHGKSFRSLTNFLNEPNVLATYRPTYAASPLRDPQTALVFCHFITATAPTISASERHTINSASMFSGRPVPKSHQGLWTYTMPMLALHHQGLLHAMLALASLHIAKLQKTSSTPSLKHYHYALRKVAKSLGNPTKRNDVATLAATLLLGFYEVTTAEHNKWNSHLAGAKQLIVQTDFVNTANRIKAHKAQLAMSQSQQFFNSSVNEYGQPYMQQHQYYDFSESNDGLDENLISTFMGWRTSYNQYGQIIEDNKEAIPPSTKPVTQSEIDKFEAQCDLFWWYAKQDMYQSIISGNRLLLPYERWTHCPPRAPIGRLDAVYGTMDHLILLMARIADFAGKDSPRKQKVFAKAQQSQAQAQSTANDYSNPSHPPITGYAIPSDGSYTPIPSAHLPPPDMDLEASTAAAHSEWLAISRALDVFEESLGPSYAALSPDHMTPLSTPFGPALYYRTYGIACIWSLYYCGRIISARVHPSMPPAAMAAAGIAAPRTAALANIIGRINGGLQPISTSVPLNPAHGAALMDACMGLFHAGVQYRDAAQRGWTITKLRDIARLTGWQTSALIASGCERAWQKAFEMGKGPKYERTMNSAAKDDRVAGRSRDPDQGPPKDNNDRRFVKVNPGTRVYWAMGILSVDEDMGVGGLRIE
ncbi:MAG: hypothetical protein Q9195_002201 [Heterodermia aff. obscurata]